MQSKNKSMNSSPKEPSLKAKPSQNLPLKITEPTEDDLAFIVDGWIRTYRKSTGTKGVPSEVYYRYHRNLIMRTLAESEVFIAKHSEHDDQLYGFIAFEERREGTVIHYIYVKRLFRKFGIASELLKQIPIAEFGFYSHDTYASKFIAPKGYVFNPYLFYERSYQ